PRRDGSARWPQPRFRRRSRGTCCRPRLRPSSPLHAAPPGDNPANKRATHTGGRAPGTFPPRGREGASGCGVSSPSVFFLLLPLTPSESLRYLKQGRNGGELMHNFITRHTPRPVILSEAQRSEESRSGSWGRATKDVFHFRFQRVPAFVSSRITPALASSSRI